MPAFTRITMQRQLAHQTRLNDMLVRTQASVSEGRLSRPSDAPADWAEVGTLSRRSAMSDAWMGNIARAKDRAAHAERVIGHISEALTRAKELMVQAAGPTGIGSGREPIAAELAAIRADIAERLAETASDGTPLFATGAALAVPVGDGLTLTSEPHLAAVNSIGGTTLDAMLADAVTAVQGGAPSLSDAATALNAGFDHITQAAAHQGITSRRLADREKSLIAEDVTRSERRSKLVDTDVAEALTTIQRGLTTLEAARATFVKINERILFDLIR